MDDRRKSDRRVSPAIGDFALEERGKLLARIAELEKLNYDFLGRIEHWYQLCAEVQVQRDHYRAERDSRDARIEFLEKVITVIDEDLDDGK